MYVVRIIGVIFTVFCRVVVPQLGFKQSFHCFTFCDTLVHESVRTLVNSSYEYIYLIMCAGLALNSK